MEDEPETQHEAPVATAESVQMPSSLDDPACSQATSGWISGIQIRRLAFFDKPDARSGLRAKQRIMRCEKQWWDANQENQTERKYEIYAEMDKHNEFLDCKSLPF